MYEHSETYIYMYICICVQSCSCLKDSTSVRVSVLELAALRDGFKGKPKGEGSILRHAPLHMYVYIYVICAFILWARLENDDSVSTIVYAYLLVPFLGSPLAGMLSGIHTCPLSGPSLSLVLAGFFVKLSQAGFTLVPCLFTRVALVWLAWMYE